MNYLSIPLNLLQFWYPQALVIFIRSFKNLILYLEEDLALGLMWKLLLVPLFHDSSFLGRILSFFFRLSRIFLGLFAFLSVGILIFTLTLFWFTLPLWIIVLKGDLRYLALGSLLLGLLLFIYHLFSHPPKKVWQIKSVDEIWQTSRLNQGQANWKNLLKTKEVRNLLRYLEKKPEDLAGLSGGSIAGSGILQSCLELGKKLAVPYLQPEHFFVAALTNIPNISGSLAKVGLTAEDFLSVLDFLKRKEQYHHFAAVWDEDFHVKHLKGINRGWLGVPTPNLDMASDDLTRQAAKEKLPDFVGRAEVVSQVVNILSLEAGRNVVIVGEPGSGRSTLVAYLAKLIVLGDAPASLATKRLVRLDLTRLLSGVKTQGELAQKVGDIFEEVKFCGNIMIYIDEIQDLGIGEVSSEFNLYSLLLPYIESSNFQFLSSTEIQNFTKILEKNGAFARLFTKVELPPASAQETVQILQNKAIEEESHKSQTSLIAIKEIAKVTSQYIHDRVLPDSALKIFLQCQNQAEDGWVIKSTVDKVFQTQVNIPVGEVEAETKQELLNLETIIHKKFIDQEEAVAAIAKTLRRAATALREQNRPIGSFLFVGPTGVGKTELAKVLSEEYFKRQGNFLRFDMSEYQAPESVSKLIGQSGEEGILTESVRLKPYTLILLDEFEKADNKVLTVFLQVLEDGRLTSGSGRTVDFTNTIIVATSNAASLTIAQGLRSGQILEQLKDKVSSELLQIFKPELINRFDEVVLFKPLIPLDLQKIVRLKLSALQKQLSDQGYMVDFADELVVKLAEKGYDAVMGARPLRRLIQDTLEARLSVMILENKLPKGEKFIVTRQELEQSESS